MKRIVFLQRRNDSSIANQSPAYNINFTENFSLNKRTIINDLKKMRGYRGGKSSPASYIYLADPKTPDKEDLIDMGEPNLINGLGEFSETVMAAFVQAMNPSGATR